MKRYHPKSWLQAISSSSPSDHMSKSPTGSYVAAQAAEERIRELERQLEGSERDVVALQLERDRLREALADAAQRMDRARSLLRKPHANWGMLDTARQWAALEGK